MTRATTPLAVAADYADALMTARRAKNLLFLLLLLFILAQLTFFFLARFGVVRLGTYGEPAPPPAASVSADAATTQPAAALTQPVAPAAGRDPDRFEPIVRYVTPLINFGAVAASIVLAVVMLLLVTIMLVGRLIGVSNVTGAFVWGVLLVVVLIPWQTFLIPDGNYPVVGGPGASSAPLSDNAAGSAAAAATAASGTAASAIPEQPAFKFPGALYTYAELKRDYAQAFTKDQIWPRAVWFWGRYAGMPVLAMLLLFVVQAKSSRGLKYALGEADINVEVSASRQDINVVS